MRPTLRCTRPATAGFARLRTRVSSNVRARTSIMRASSKSVVQCLVCVVEPPPGVLFAIQRGRAELLPPFVAQSHSIWFAITLHLGPMLADRSLNFRGEFVQGRPGDRFIYINSGTLAGQASSCWQRRAKLKLSGVPRSVVEPVVNHQGRAIQAMVLGTAHDGGPTCATLLPNTVTWSVAEGAA